MCTVIFRSWLWTTDLRQILQGFRGTLNFMYLASGYLAGIIAETMPGLFTNIAGEETHMLQLGNQYPGTVPDIPPLYPGSGGPCLQLTNAFVCIHKYMVVGGIQIPTSIPSWRLTRQLWLFSARWLFQKRPQLWVK